MTEQKKEWYRHPMVWMVIAIPASAVIVGSILLTLSITTFDGLVEDDYYKKGKEINQVLERDEFALEKEISAEVGIKTCNLYAAQRYRQLDSGNHIARNQPAQTCLLMFLDQGACEYFPQGIGSFLHRLPPAAPFSAKCGTNTCRKAYLAALR